MLRQWPNQLLPSPTSHRSPPAEGKLELAASKTSEKKSFNNEI